MSRQPLFDRRSFLALAASSPLLAAGCSNSTSFTPAAIPPGPVLPAGTQVADLRFGILQTPPASPGFDPAGDAKALIVAGTPSPATAPVPGLFATGSYAAGERYVIKVPQAWNGKLAVVGTPATRSEFASDAIWGDFLISQGYAYAASNKTIPYNAVLETAGASQSPATSFPIPFDLLKLETNQFTYRLGALAPGKTSIANWNADFATLTLAAKNFLRQYLGSFPTRTYAVGLSNGGAQVRSLLEAHPELVDGGVDWSGVFWSPSLNILTYMPKFLAAMPTYISSGFTDAGAIAAIKAAGYPADLLQASTAHPSLWLDYYSNTASFYTDLTVFEYGLIVDPQASSSFGVPDATPNPANPVNLPGTVNGTGLALPATRAAYAPSAAAQNVIAGFTHTGAIGKPLVSIAGAADMFVTVANNATPYLNAVNGAGRGSSYWQYIVSGGTHVDTFSAFGYNLQPQLPFAWAAFAQLVAIVEQGLKPAGSGTQQTVSSPGQIVNR